MLVIGIGGNLALVMDRGKIRQKGEQGERMGGRANGGMNESDQGERAPVQRPYGSRTCHRKTAMRCPKEVQTGTGRVWLQGKVLWT